MKSLGFLLTCLLLFPVTAKARMVPGAVAEMAIAPLPQPPAYNPHPPQSNEDKRRVDFAVQEILAYYGPNIEIRHPHVIPWSWENFQKNRKDPPALPMDHSNPRVIIEAQSAALPAMPPAQDVARAPVAMPAPQLKADEYMVHSYVKFPQDPRWHHLDVILTETSSGQLSRRNFFSIPMPQDVGQLPHGVVC